MSLIEKLGLDMMGPKSTDDMDIELGGRTICQQGYAIFPGTLGVLIANTPDGMLKKTINVPEGITAVNEKYIMNKMVNHTTPAEINFGHEKGDNHLKVGKDCKIYVLAPGVVFVKTPDFSCDSPKFDTKLEPLDHNELDIPRSSRVSFNEKEGVGMLQLMSEKVGCGGVKDL